MTTRVVIASHQPLIVCGLRDLLTRDADIEVAGEGAPTTGIAGLLRTARPDVIVLDTSLSDGDGPLLARELRQRDPLLGIVILAASDGDGVLFRAAESGASALVTTAAPAAEVLAAIRHAAVAAASFSAAGLAVALGRRRRQSGRLTLSGRETEVLRLLRDGLSVPALAEHMYISHSTAKTYVARLYEKLGAANRAQVLMTAVRYGLIGGDPEVASPVAFLPAQRSAPLARTPVAAS
jgi:DNA-binding NarL/FixJ family response regulator